MLEQRPAASIADEFSPAVLASSLSAEDMVLTHAIARAGLPIGIFVLDTGRLHAETLALIDEIAQALRHRRPGLPARPRRAVDEYVARARPRRVLRQRRAAQALLRDPQGRAARPRARRQARLDHRPAPRAVGRPRRARRARVRRRARPGEIQPARRLDRSRGVGLPARAPRALQPALRPGLPLDRLRAVHPPGAARRGRARRPLVVGAARAQGMRAARRADSARL